MATTPGTGPERSAVTDRVTLEGRAETPQMPQTAHGTSQVGPSIGIREASVCKTAPGSAQWACAVIAAPGSPCSISPLATDVANSAAAINRVSK
ncbi:hypothetical protein B1A74_09730 [Thioalkalivibrio halophilus]|uniref:Uncharacterized protein n=1 Tax=Thioalkalivibrio halophilus TaxID=252474 RepID=A0A1V2ZX35_9GAMM|nr:hypothetical protein B1A74_09730 [Thioalkalivibrio halophilus]